VAVEPGQDRHLEREPRRVRSVGDEAVIGADDPLLALQLVVEDVAEQAALLELVVGPRRIQLQRDGARRDRRGDELGMRVPQRGARGAAVVLENEDVFEPLVAAQVEPAQPVDVHDARQVLHRHVRHAQLVIRALDDHLVRPDAAHAVVNSGALLLQIALDHERRELVGHHPDFPSRRIGRGTRRADGEDLGGRLVLVPRAERAERSRRLHFLAGDDEIPGALAPLHRDDHPPLLDRIVSQFRHVSSLHAVANRNPPLRPVTGSGVQR